MKTKLEWIELEDSIKEDIKHMMTSSDGNVFLCLMDMKQSMLDKECYTMLANLRDLEEEMDCPIPYKLCV